MPRNSRVYIPNSGARHDFSPAKEHGDLIYVSDSYISPFKTGYIYRLWDEVLKESEPFDYILICSLNIICSIGTAIFAHKHGRLNLLQYRRKYNKYDVRCHIIGEEENGQEEKNRPSKE